MKKRKSVLWVMLLLLAICLVIYAIFGLGRTGGKVFFEAVILEVNGQTVTAEVLSSGHGVLSPRLPHNITFTADPESLENLRVGDTIEGEWQYGSRRGSNVRVFWFVKVQETAN